MRLRKYSKIFAADFETTVFKGQTFTEVWAAASVELGTEDVKVFHSIEEQFDYFKSLKENIIVYFHNLKFDGSFWLSYLITKAQYKQAYKTINGEMNTAEWLDEQDMPNKSFRYSISDRGQWYNIKIKTNNKVIEIRDSLKLLPFSLKRIGISFKTKHKKLEMNYDGARYAGCPISDEEKEYIANDVLVLKEALEIMLNEGHTKLTIGSCCLDEYKKIMGKSSYEAFYPNVYEIECPPEIHVPTVGDYIHKAYHGGWCYLVKGKEEKIYGRGITADVNSLYPSVMSGESGNLYPVGAPKFWCGNFIPAEAKVDGIFYFVRFRTRFHVKHGYLPFIQIKTSFLYSGTEMLETSDVRNPKTGTYSRYYYDADGNLHDTDVTLTMTMTDYQLFLEHYDTEDFEILDGCYFMGAVGLFDDYIDKYKQMKLTEKGARRELAKLFLNNLYGKMAANTDSSFKVAYIKDGGALGYMPVHGNDKVPGYIPVGAAITSYARNFTIRVAQKNFHGVDKPGFIYADTDSIHCDLPADEIQGIKVDDKNFLCWKLESTWDTAIFTRQKTYIEHVVEENLQPIDEPYYNVKCAGMPEHCKQLFLQSLEGTQEEELCKHDIYEDGKLKKKQYTEEEQAFLFDENGNKIRRTLKDFQVGLTVPGKLLPKNIPGGILLTQTTYQMR